MNGTGTWGEICEAEPIDENAVRWSATLAGRKAESVRWANAAPALPKRDPPLLFRRDPGLQAEESVLALQELEKVGFVQVSRIEVGRWVRDFDLGVELGGTMSRGGSNPGFISVQEENDLAALVQELGLDWTDTDTGQCDGVREASLPELHDGPGPLDEDQAVRSGRLDSMPVEEALGLGELRGPLSLSPSGDGGGVESTAGISKRVAAGVV